MKRLDRAMYAFFLLALLADLARAQVPASFGGDASGGLIQSAARQIRVGPAGEVVLVSRRADRIALPAARGKVTRGMATRFALTGWARILSAQTRQSTPVMLASLRSGSETGPWSALTLDSGETSPIRGVFAHTGSPAP